ncbi:MarR family transcriptional regulator [Rubrobacter marinus]|uniref:MarR family transcriptional regulator n=1 Tax=Rubrobacter marinus TaxID=2653852 RepID=A0A6G8PTQ7_9ACTN|nr:MarR family winged helix-turn-helix transcriptional regulator [Rubrobacter marinus]QIN77346.1 MarR family transcriptional regulator [Rubrobacter marinus]
MDRERLVDEVLMLLPVLARGLGRPDPSEVGELARRGIPVDATLSPGHVQVLIALGRGPHSIGRLAEAVGVTPPAASQLVDRLSEHGMVERRPDPADRRVVLVDYVPGMQDIARRMMEGRGRKLGEVLGRMTEDEVRAFLKGLRLLVESFEGAHGEEKHESHR